MKRFFYLILFISLFIPQNVFAATSAEELYAKAYGYIYKNNGKEAIKIFEKSIETYPDCAFLYAGLGDAYLKTGNIENAINSYTLAQKKKYSTDSYKIDFYNATILKTMYDIKNGINNIFLATQYSDNPVLFKNIKYLLTEQYTKTVVIMEDYFNENDAELNKINALKSSGKKEEALKAYINLFNSNTNNYQAANNAGITLIELKDYQLAEKYLQIAYELNRNSSVILNNLAVLRFKQQKYKEMDTLFNETLKIKSDYAAAINNKMICKIHQDIQFYKYDNAKVLLDIMKKDYENIYVVRTLAKIYALKGDYNNALTIISSVNSPYNFKLFSQKAYIAYKANEYSSALNYIDKAISLYSDNSSDYEIKGRILSSLGRYSDARINFQKVIKKDKTNTSSYYYNALNYAQEGDYNNAMTQLKYYISLKKGNIQSANIKFLLN